MKETKHWYLPLDKHEGWLRQWILEDHKEWRPNVYGQCKSWLDMGLQPRAVSRDLDWGIPVPVEGAEGKVLYVWFDAPIGYISNTKELLPDSPPYFGKDQWTDKPARFFVNEIIREKILLYYDKEIPYSVEVVVEEFKEEPKKIHIRAVINVERDSQKGIIIGKQGKALKKVATEARRELERFFGKTIFLETYVKVDKDWRSSDKELRNFGYQLD